MVSRGVLQCDCKCQLPKHPDANTEAPTINNGGYLHIQIKDKFMSGQSLVNYSP